MGIAKIERVALRDVWPHEAYDLTTWLEENIDVLSDAIGREIDNVEREKRTESAFRVDLVAGGKDGTLIVIENQLEKSNHDHLGKLITYLVAMQAGIAIGSIRELYAFVIDCLERQEVGLWTSKVSRCGFRRRAG